MLLQRTGVSVSRLGYLVTISVQLLAYLGALQYAEFVSTLALVSSSNVYGQQPRSCLQALESVMR